MSLGTRLWIVAAVVLVAAGVALFLERAGKSRESEAAAGAAEARLRESEAARIVAERTSAEERKELLDRVEAAQKRLAEAEAALRAKNGELLGARAESERARRESAEEIARWKAEALRAAQEAIAARAPAREEGPETSDPPTASAAHGPESEPGAPKDPPPPPSLAPTAVVDPRQVRKVLDSLNALLAGAGGKEAYRVVSADAVEGDRLVRATLEARGPDGEVLKSFQAEEARFDLAVGSGTLGIRLKEGTVTYPGRRAVLFPDKAYTAWLSVDPTPFLAASHPLVSIR